MSRTEDSTILDEFELGDMRVRYRRLPGRSEVGLQILPVAADLDPVLKRRFLDDEPEIGRLPKGCHEMPADQVLNLVQLKCAGDPYRLGFGQGTSMLNNGTVDRLDWQGVEALVDGNARTLVSRFTHPAGLTIAHHLTHESDRPYLVSRLTICNEGPEPVKLEHASSFALDGISPFDRADSHQLLHLHRMRSHWSSEGKHESRSLEDLHLERTWLGDAVLCERFGQVGSMPVRGFFPWIALEDRATGVFWGAQLAHCGSWQMECFRTHDSIGIAGGLGDREFAHWTKTLNPGETFSTPTAFVSVVRGCLDDLCDRLTRAQEPPMAVLPKPEESLPVIFNEWCASWGNPSHDWVARALDRIKGSGIRYFVIDAGWFKEECSEWFSAQGDWVPSPRLFPDGLEKTASMIRAAGLIPGIWFEWEVAGKSSRAFHDHANLFLQRDGYAITAGGRRFWDLRNPEAHQILHNRVVRLLRDNGFGYLKIDYNDTIGMGPDDSESPGEGLRQHLVGVFDFLAQMKRELPDLVIENCSSGGHRLEPAMQAVCAMGSFSDAHETVEIPLIAAALHRLILPRQSQVWAVVHSDDDRFRFDYVLSAGFLGRLCLSGDILDLDEQQWRRVCEAIAFYKLIAPIIKDGISTLHGSPVRSMRQPVGWQAVVRKHRAHDEILVVIHSFGAPVPDNVSIPLPQGNWKIAGELTCEDDRCEVSPDCLLVPFGGSFRSRVIHLKII